MFIALKGQSFKNIFSYVDGSIEIIPSLQIYRTLVDVKLPFCKEVRPNSNDLHKKYKDENRGHVEL